MRFLISRTSGEPLDKPCNDAQSVDVWNDEPCPGFYGGMQPNWPVTPEVVEKWADSSRDHLLAVRDIRKDADGVWRRKVLVRHWFVDVDNLEALCALVQHGGHRIILHPPPIGGSRTFERDKFAIEIYDDYSND